MKKEDESILSHDAKKRIARRVFIHSLIERRIFEILRRRVRWGECGKV